MTIAACLCWYDETLEYLDRCVTSLAGVCEHLVALDGRWQHMDGPDISPIEQEATIRQACRAADIRGHIQTPLPSETPYEDQPAKRTQLLELAQQVTDADWLLVIDADEWIESSQAGLMLGLERTEHDAAAVTVQDTNPKLGCIRRAPRRLLRAQPLEYAGAHNAIRRLTDGGWLVHRIGFEHLLEPAAECTEQLVIHHDVRMRPAGRQNRQIAYYERRGRLGIESRTKTFA